MTAGTLRTALHAAAREWEQRPALVFGDEVMTHGDLRNATLRLAGIYRRLQVGHGDRVACAVSNRPEYVIALGAAWTRGAVHIGMDHELTGRELSAVIRRTQPKVLLYELRPGSADHLRTVSLHHPELEVIVLGETPVPVPEQTRYRRVTDFTEWLHEPEGDQLHPDAPAPGNPAVIFITSGTTGTPKATIGFQGNLGRRWLGLGAWLGFTPDDVHLAQMPLSHGFGLMMAVAALLKGGQLVLVERFSAEETLRLVETRKITVLNGAPAHFKLILNRLDQAPRDVRSLRLSIGTAAAFSPDLVRSIWNELGVSFTSMYGSSEGVGVATSDPADLLAGSVGRPAKGSVAIVGRDREPLLAGQVGEIAFSRDEFPVTYWVDHSDAASSGGEQSPAEHRAPVPESGGRSRGWFYSGDLGRLDDQGRLYIMGRLKHQIDRGGLKVDPVEVETLLLRCPGVADAAVIGLPNPVLEETVCACVVPSPERAPTLDELRTFLDDKLAPYKLPEELCILDRIPRTRIGKVDVQRLRAEAEGSSRQSLPRCSPVRASPAGRHHRPMHQTPLAK